MKIFIYIIIALGMFEIGSNLFHLFKGNKKIIGLSAMRQHRELSLELESSHFFFKTVIMFVFGFLFTGSGLLALINANFHFFYVVLGLFALYGVVQALYYRRPYKVWMSLIVYITPFILLLFLSKNAHGTTKEFVINQTIHENFVFPFILAVEPIKRLLVVSFKGDPEYEMIEPQYYDDLCFGKGLRVLMYRTDKKIDVYYQPDVFFDSTTFAVGKGLGIASKVQMSPDRFEILKTGVDVDIAFTDYKGRRIELLIKENSVNHDRLPFLAPVGNDMEKPSKLLLAYMQEFDFVNREGTIIHAQVGDRKLTPSKFAIKRNGQKTYFARYASKLTIGEINPPNTALFVLENAQGNIKTGIHNFSLNKEQMVTNYWLDYGTDRIDIKFENGFPNLLSLPQNQQVKGTWIYSVSGTVLTGGEYSLLRKGDLVLIEMDVTKKWEPKDLPLSLRAFTYFVRSFRVWPTTYKWSGRANLMDMSIQGSWIRK